MSTSIEVKGNNTSKLQIILDGTAVELLDPDVIESVVYNFLFDPADERTASLIEQALQRKYTDIYVYVGIANEIDRVIIRVEANHFAKQ